MSAPPKICIVICTYNRAEYVKSCLGSLTKQKANKNSFSVLIVNNNSKDQTDQVANEFKAYFPFFKLVTETNQGLSYARNRGIQEADTDWIVYLDDDAKAAPDFIDQCLLMIETQNYTVFGGVFLPWYKFGQPKWYKDSYGSNKLKYATITSLTGYDYASGGIMAFKKNLIVKYGGFNTQIGMIGDKIGYAEETEIQERMRADGIDIGYNPNWIIYHVVAEHKLHVNSFFIANFAAGRDKVLGKRIPTHSFYLFLIFIIAIGLTIFDSTRNGLKLLFNKDYFIENWLIDSFRKTAKRFGIIYTALLLKDNESR